MISRFLINLRKAAEPQANETAMEHFSRFSVPGFHIPTIDSVVGDMGEPLDLDLGDEVDMSAVDEQISLQGTGKDVAGVSVV